MNNSYLNKFNKMIIQFFQKLYNSIKVNILKDKKIVSLLLFLLVTILIIIIIKVILSPNPLYAIDHKQKKIYFGQTCDLHNNRVSIDYSIGFIMAFQKINKSGILNGYTLHIIRLDDKYETRLAIVNSKLLIDYYNVLALIGSFGTPTTVGIFDESIKNKKIGLIGPFTAGTSYRKLFNKYRIYMNTDFYLEYDLIIKNMLKNNYRNISIIYQDDIYGNYFYNAFVDYLVEQDINITIVSTGKYERNSNDLDSSFTTAFEVVNAYDYDDYNTSHVLNNIDAVLLFTAEMQISNYLSKIKKINPNIAIYYNFFTGRKKSNLKYMDDFNTDNIYQTLLSYNLEKYPKLNSIYKEQIDIYNNNNVNKIEETNSSMEQGFYSGLMIGEVLKKFKDARDINRESFIDMFYNMETINVYDMQIGPFIKNVNSEGVRYVELNQLTPQLNFKTIDSYTKPIH
jgi:hypothetical protein